ncbi:hypothetical protein FAZ69_15935 [Trinickia terrae]|uniref:Uncharacterized protein n=1 Tax=Trinickia terrae TaxID=2571161 RepID=A0A4U1I3J8_9BURK|nr:hypothetical protein [Trinickia terrae]TKC87772.1 hypothetical protein FAZ69_15935 [Trinickia terrae]
MKSRFVWPLSAALLLAAAGAVSAAETQPQPQDQQQSQGQATMMQNADTSAQTGSDTSFGGVGDTRSASGGVKSRGCTPKSQCDIFFGGE